ncbi:MAG: ATP synthase F0 subunit B, partial [Chthoniobacter sp.]
MTYLPLLAAEGGIVDSLVDSAHRTGETFGFNAWLFFSQVISFCIVAFLLQKFAYKPVLTVLETRRQKIAEGLANAEKIKQQLAESETRFQEILAKANAEGQKMIDDASAAAKTVGDRE